MEVVALAQTKEALIAKALLGLIPAPPSLIEEDPGRRTAFAFSIWPVVKVDGAPLFFGLHALVKFLFSRDLPTASLSALESLLALADAIYAAAVPIIVKALTILIKYPVLQAAQSKLATLIATSQALLPKVPPAAAVYLQTVLSIVSSLGVDVSPASAAPISVEGLSDEAISFAHDVLGIPERYAMSPPPTKPMYYSTPIYYVNGAPHIGHVFSTTLVDALAKWYKLRQIPIIYSSGTDEHGLKVQTTALAKGLDPQTWCDQTATQFQRAFEDFDLRPDVFIRTTEPRHLRVASIFWKILADRGYIYKGIYSGWYSRTEECFIPDNQVKEVTGDDGVVKRINTSDGAELVWSSESNYLFKLSEMQGRLLEWMDANPTCIIPRCYYNQIRSTVSAGLHDISVSRQKANVSWGVPVPGDDTQTMYVWIEALVNYLTVAGWDGVSNGIWPADVHTIGKDILKFHGVFWPAFLLAAGVEPYKHVLVHGWWTMDTKKMSKSIGNTLDPYQLTQLWGLEAVKYFLLREVTLVSDSDYSVEAMLARHNSDLGDVLGNLVLRIIAPRLLPDMTVPQPGELLPADLTLVEDVETLPGTVDHFIAFGRTRLALAAIWDVLRDMNKYATVQEPWALKGQPERVATVMYVLIEALRIAMTCLWPFMPRTASTVLSALGSPDVAQLDKDTMFKFGLLKPGTKVTGVPQLFPRKVAPD
jgi:methionyl-tRNA synthetase